MEQFNELQSEFKIIGTLVEQSTSDSLQRTEEWRKKRRSCFTGSENSDLMGCGRSTSKMPWGSLEKLVDFGVTAEKQVYIVGKRRTAIADEMEKSAKQMNHGKEYEPLLIQQLLKDGVITDFEELGFEYFGDYKFGGASADGRAKYKDEVVGLELKCTVSWDGHYERKYEPVHDKHKDFWQHQSEMLAMGVDKLLYVVAEPMTVEKYSIEIVKASPVHQKALLNRCKIADKAISLWGEYGYKEALQIACATFKEEEL